jgi:hypothetical protein
MMEEKNSPRLRKDIKPEIQTMLQTSKITYKERSAIA